MRKRLFGEALVGAGVITDAQLRVGLAYQEKLRQVRIGELLFEMKLVPAREIERAIVAQLEAREQGGPRHPLGEYLVRDGALSSSDLERVLGRQQRLRERKIGEILVELGLLSEVALVQAIRSQLEEMAQG